VLGLETQRCVKHDLQTEPLLIGEWQRFVKLQIIAVLESESFNREYFRGGSLIPISLLY
jgi:hypothetical protein